MNEHGNEQISSLLWNNDPNDRMNSLTKHNTYDSHRIWCFNENVVELNIFCVFFVLIKSLAADFWATESFQFISFSNFIRKSEARVLSKCSKLLPDAALMSTTTVAVKQILFCIETKFAQFWMVQWQPANRKINCLCSGAKHNMRKWNELRTLMHYLVNNIIIIIVAMFDCNNRFNERQRFWIFCRVFRAQNNNSIPVLFIFI